MAKTWVTFPQKTICHESIHVDLYTHDKDCHYEMDDHKLYTFIFIYIPCFDRSTYGPGSLTLVYTSLTLLASLFLFRSSPALGCFSPFCLGAIM